MRSDTSKKSISFHVTPPATAAQWLPIGMMHHSRCAYSSRWLYRSIVFYIFLGIDSDVVSSLKFVS